MLGVWPIEGAPPRDCSKAGAAARILWIRGRGDLGLLPRSLALAGGAPHPATEQSRGGSRQRTLTGTPASAFHAFPCCPIHPSSPGGKSPAPEYSTWGENPSTHLDQEKVASSPARETLGSLVHWEFNFSVALNVHTRGMCNSHPMHYTHFGEGALCRG